MNETYAHRRLICLWLPLIAMGMVTYLCSFAATLTLNGLGILGLGITWLGVFASAYDAGES